MGNEKKNVKSLFFVSPHSSDCTEFEVSKRSQRYLIFDVGFESNTDLRMMMKELQLVFLISHMRGKGLSSHEPKLEGDIDSFFSICSW